MGVNAGWITTESVLRNFWWYSRQYADSIRRLRLLLIPDEVSYDLTHNLSYVSLIGR